MKNSTTKKIKKIKNKLDKNLVRIIRSEGSSAERSSSSAEEIKSKKLGLNSKDRKVEEISPDSFRSNYLKKILDAKPSEQSNVIRALFFQSNSPTLESIDKCIYELKKTNLSGNEGACFLFFCESILEKEAIELLVEAYNLERKVDLPSKDFFLMYQESDTKFNVLHKLATAITVKHSQTSILLSSDWSAFNHVSREAPSLKEQKDKWEKTAEELIFDQIDIGDELGGIAFTVVPNENQ